VAFPTAAIPRSPAAAQEKTLVIVTRRLPDAVETRMMELFDARH
jgi:hypothetical protein